jgi:AcrR family transcriptional regulator
MTMTPSATRRLPRAQRRESILAGAAHAFAGAGFSATSMNDVAAASGVTPLIVYRHFESKEELYRELLASVSAQLRDRLVNWPDPEGYGLSAGPLLEIARENPDGFRLLWRHATREPQFASEAEALRVEALQIARTALDGLVAPELLEWATHAVLGYLVEAVLAWLEYGDPSRDEQLVAAINQSLRAGVRGWSDATQPG